METSLDPVREALRRDLETLRDLPSPSRILREIWHVVEDPRASAAMLAAVLARDTALSARTLRLANSAYFGLRQPAQDVRAACVVLGFETVRGLAVSAAALDRLAAPAARILDLDAFWLHSTAVATGANAVGRRLGIPDTGTAFCGGMLHDLGQLVLATTRPREYGALLRANPAGASRDAEAGAFGAAHDEVGGWAAAHWSYPLPLQEAIADHHGPPSGGEWRRWGAVVHIGNVLAHRHGMAGTRAGAVPAAAPVGAAANGKGAAAGDPGTEGIAPEPGALAVLGLAPDAFAALEASFAAALPEIHDLAVAARSAA